MLKKCVLYFLCVLCFAASAQSRKRTFRQSELGFFGGGSYYIGDINQRGHFSSTNPAAGIYFRYSTNYRFAFRFGLNYGEISGNDALSAEADQRERNLNFRSKIYDLHSIAEFNFVEYRIGHDRYKFTMFVFAGMAGFYFNPQTNTGLAYENLREQRSEGQSKTYPKYQFSVPFGVGLKFNVGKKCGIGLEWGPRRTFTDYLDDIKGNYPEIAVASEPGQVVNTNTSPGNMRGNPSTKDWYFFYGITLSIKLPGSKECHKTF